MKVKELTTNKERVVKFKSIEVGQCFCGSDGELYIRMCTLAKQLSNGRPYKEYKAVKLSDGTPHSFDDEDMVTLVRAGVSYYKLLEHAEE